MIVVAVVVVVAVIMIMVMIMVMVVVMVMVMVVVVIVIMIVVMMIMTVGEEGVFEGEGDAVGGMADGLVPEGLLLGEGWAGGEAAGDDDVFEGVGPVVEVGVAVVWVAGCLGVEDGGVHGGFPFFAGDDALFDEEVTDGEGFGFRQVAEGRRAVVFEERGSGFPEEVFAELDGGHGCGS